jgi:Ca2+/Na+ antiporter
MSTQLVIKQGVKKYGASITLLLFILFILGAISLPKLSATREDALRVKAEYEAQQRLKNTHAKQEKTHQNLDASLFELKHYTINYQTNHTKTLQEKIKSLKTRSYILFDNYQESQKKSRYTIKVQRDKSQEVLLFLESLSPSKVHLDVENIKASITSTVDEEQLLREKLQKLEIILSDATNSYNELLKLAQTKNNIDALTKLIDLKINTLNRLTREKNSILDQIYTISKSKKELLERLNYVIFTITIDEFLYFDTEQLKQTWKYEVKTLVSHLNSLGQSLTTTLLSFILQLFEFFIYFIIMLFILKLIIFIIKKVFSLEHLSIFEKVKEE